MSDRPLPSQPSNPGSPDTDANHATALEAGRAFSRLVQIMQILRSDAGCPWDREQTLQSLASYVLEEAYEVVDAIERDDPHDLRGEIGDLLFEGVFLAQVASEQGAFTAADAVASVNAKLERRHPHVPALRGDGRGSELESASQVVEQWDAIKAREREEAGRRREYLLDGIPRSLPALMRAHEIGKRCARVGFDWRSPDEVLDKVDEELRELRAAHRAEGPDRVREELGDLLFAVANLCRQLDVEPEAVLRAANDKFTRRFNEVERRLAARGIGTNQATLEDMESEWTRVKAGE